jgi:NhaP-type Na+/H+ or K+/H+ antiporter
MWATMVALACGVIGVVAVVVAVLTGHKFDYASSQAVPDPALAELLYDFAAL